MSESITELYAMDWDRWPELLATFGDAVKDLDLPTLQRLIELDGSGVDGMSDDLVCIQEIEPGWFGRLFGAQPSQQLDPDELVLWRRALARASTAGSSVSWAHAGDLAGALRDQEQNEAADLLDAALAYRSSRDAFEKLGLDGVSSMAPGSCDVLVASLAQLRGLPEHLQEAREDILATLHARSASQGLVWLNEV